MFVRRVKMKKALELIQTQQYHVHEVAEQVGYNDVATFRKHFANFYNTTPSKYYEIKWVRRGFVLYSYRLIGDSSFAWQKNGKSHIRFIAHFLRICWVTLASLLTTPCQRGDQPLPANASSAVVILQCYLTRSKNIMYAELTD